MSTMIAMRLESQQPIEQNPLIREVLPLPAPRPGQVRIRVSVCGVCHTDLHTVEGDIHPPELPITPGHQAVGTIEAVGESVDLPLGLRVGVPWLGSADGDCEFCARGLENLCPRARFTGFHHDGGFAQTMLAEARYALPIPESIPDMQAAPLLCAGIVGFRSLRLAEIEPGERVGLAGFGASAHLCIQVLNHWNCKTFVFTRSEGHRQHARGLGAAWVGGAEDKAPEALDRAVIFAPAGHLVPAMLEKLRPGGTLALNAIHMSPIPEMPYRTVYGERTLRSVANATYRDGAEFLELAARIGIKATTKSYRLEDANLALQDVKHSRIDGEAVLEINP